MTGAAWAQLAGWPRRLVLALVCLAAFLPGIAALPPIDRDEARFAQATKQMLQSGDLIDIRFQDQHRYKKPAGIYWLQAAAVTLSGGDGQSPIWHYRLASVLAGVAAVLLIDGLGTFLFGPVAGLAAALMLAGLFGLGFEARIAKTDATVLAVTLAAQAALARFYIDARQSRQTHGGWWWTFWLATGAGVLIKGPITPLVSALTIAGIALFDRDWRWMKALKPWRGLMIAALVILPWFMAITAKSGGAFWAESVGKDMLGKVAGGAESHGAPPGYYVLTYSLYMWPFAVVALDGGLKALNRLREPRLLFCLAWYVPFWLVLEATPTKLPHYPLPAYPAILLLGAWALMTASGRETPLKNWQIWLRRLTLLGLGLMTLGFAALAAGALPYATGAASITGAIAALLALMAGWLASGIRAPLAPLPRIAASAAAAIAYMALLTGAVLPAVTPLWLSPQIASAYDRAKVCPDSVLTAVAFHEPSLVFLAGTLTNLADLDGAAKALLAADGCGMALLPAEREPELASILGGRALETVAAIDGFNYSNGKAMHLVMVRAAR